MLPHVSHSLNSHANHYRMPVSDSSSPQFEVMDITSYTNKVLNADTFSEGETLPSPYFYLAQLTLDCLSLGLLTYDQNVWMAALFHVLNQ